MPLINGHIGFARDSMRSNGIQEYPFKKVNTLGFAAVFEENGRRLNATNTVSYTHLTLPTKA